MDNMDIKDSKLIKGKIEILDKNGDLYFSTKNLILTASRSAILQILFNDNKIKDAIEVKTPGIISDLPTNGKKLICGFTLGDNGANVNVSGTTIKVPSHRDTLSNNTFNSIPFISVSVAGDIINLNNNDSYENLNEIINNTSSSSNPSVSIDDNGNIVEYDDVTIAGVRYFGRKDNNYYCKAFDVINSECNYLPSTGEIDYVTKLYVESQDCIGETISEIGLVLANCSMSSDNRTITSIDDQSVKLATRATFTPVPLTSELLSSFIIRYHIYI